VDHVDPVSTGARGPLARHGTPLTLTCGCYRVTGAGDDKDLPLPETNLKRALT